jgi:hypothetical protein
MDSFSLPRGLEQRLFNSLANKYTQGGVAKKKKKKNAQEDSEIQLVRASLTVEECKQQLCKAAKLPVSGSKGAIVKRLLDSEVGGLYKLSNLADA